MFLLRSFFGFFSDMPLGSSGFGDRLQAKVYLVAVVAQGHLSPPRAFIFFSAKLRVSLLVAKSSCALIV